MSSYRIHTLYYDAAKGTDFDVPGWRVIKVISNDHNYGRLTLLLERESFG